MSLGLEVVEELFQVDVQDFHRKGIVSAVRTEKSTRHKFNKDWEMLLSLVSPRWFGEAHHGVGEEREPWWSRYG